MDKQNHKFPKTGRRIFRAPLLKRSIDLKALANLVFRRRRTMPLDILTARFTEGALPQFHQA
jgi:hypothetical protein